MYIKNESVYSIVRMSLLASDWSKSVFSHILNSMAAEQLPMGTIAFLYTINWFHHGN